jgi:hypothetical protein
MNSGGGSNKQSATIAIALICVRPCIHTCGPRDELGSGEPPLCRVRASFGALGALAPWVRRMRPLPAACLYPAFRDSAEFLDAVAPQWALVQSGYRNRFGHPSPVPLQRYAERHIAVRESPRCGAALWRSDRPSMVHCHREDGRRYWHHVAP